MTEATRRKAPSLRMIATFEALARLGSRTAAAAELNVTTGAIGKQIRALEQWLGVPLFETDARDPVMTLAGRQLAQAVTAGMDMIRAGLEQVSPPFAGSVELRVLAPATLAMTWLVPRLHRFEQVEPRYRIRVQATHTGEDWVTIPHDAAIRRDGFVPSGHVSEILQRERLTAVAAPGLAAPGMPPDALPLLESRSRPGDLDRWLAAAGVERLGLPRRSFTHFYIAYEAALAGLGLLVAPTLITQADVEAGRLARPWESTVVLGATYALVHPIGSDRRDHVAPLRAWLREEFARSE